MAEGVGDPLLAQEEQQHGQNGAAEEYSAVSYGELTRNFVLMGWTAFGGPSAHIALFETVRPSARLMDRRARQSDTVSSTHADTHASSICCVRW